MSLRVENGTTSSFDWGKLGPDKWQELAQACGTSELQTRFAAARHAGASAAVASRLAGYADSGDGGARRAGYAALRSTGVQRLLELAAIESPDEAAISDAEVDAKIARLIRCPDANVSLKAIGARAKHRDRQRRRR